AAAGLAGPRAGTRPQDRAARPGRHLPPLSRERGMTGPLVRKLLRDVRLALLLVALLLAAFQCLWVKIVERLSGQLLPALLWLAGGRNVSGEEVEAFIFQGPGRIMQTLMGGTQISLFRPT